MTLTWPKLNSNTQKPPVCKISSHLVFWGLSYRHPLVREPGLCSPPLQKLDTRRDILCLSFAKKCLKNEKVKSFFPYNNCSKKIKTRHYEKFKVNHANTERYRKSTIPYLQKMLNNEEQQKRNFTRTICRFMNLHLLYQWHVDCLYFFSLWK